MKEIKVRLHSIDEGWCMEIWESELKIDDKIQYFSRDTYGDFHFWGYLADAPYGYCEKLDYVESDIVFIVCDKNWKEVTRSGNSNENYIDNFPTLSNC